MTKLLDDFRPLLDQIAAGAVERERDRRLPSEEIKTLAEHGIGSLRVPEEFGGRGIGLGELSELYIELAAADSNIAQALRGHFAFVELLLEQPSGEFRDYWLAVVAEGAIVGNSESEKTGNYGNPSTAIVEKDGKFLLSGTKYYTTGTYFSDYTWTTAVLKGPDAAETLVSLPVDLATPGVQVVDDWDGFGQRLTASGTTEFSEVPVDPRWIVERTDAPTLVWPALQLNLLTVLVGAAEAAVREAGELVRTRTRNAWNPEVETSLDPGTVFALGDARSRVTLLRGAVIDAARRLGATPPGLPESDEVEAIIAGLWPVVADQAQYVASHVFDAVGASATISSRAIDRHWRNIRTVASNNPVYLQTRAVGEWEIGRIPVGTVIHDALKPLPV